MVKEFKFTDKNYQDVSDTLKKSMAGMLGLAVEDINCKGIRIFFVHEPSGTLMSEGFFVDDFNPEEYGDEDK